MKTEDTKSNYIPDRVPAVAGTFYSSDPDELRHQLKDSFSNAIGKQSTNPVLAIISPHAGYVFSAKVAASAFQQIDADKVYDHIFILGSSHRVDFNGASVYPGGNFVTPLGRIPVDELGLKLAEDYPVFKGDTSAHSKEHSLEVQLPFLQYTLHRDFSIVPIVLGTHSPQTCVEIAKALKPYFNERNLFIVSTDFSHYPSYEVAREIDGRMAEAVVSNDPKKLLKTIKEIDEKRLPNVLTSMCGWTSVLTLLNMSSEMPDLVIRKVDYQNSGDVDYGDTSRVVGYVALSVEKRNEDFSLNNTDKEKLLAIARGNIISYVTHHKRVEINEIEIDEVLKKSTGAFVSVYVGGNLRGCLGTFREDTPLYRVIQEMAISAATRDSRFDPVDPSEIDDLKVEISVLSPMKKITSIDEIILGKHGIYIRKGSHSGTFLPQVIEGRNWTREQFLGYCARDKAGIGWEGWKEAEIYTYEAIVFQK